MRPPQNAGESDRRRTRRASTTRGFNEAPAERGGKFGLGDDADHGRVRFNEAPAERGGKCGGPGAGVKHQQQASMRPPQNAGESRLAAAAHWSRLSCFNEAPAERGGKYVSTTATSRAGAKLQ